MISKTKLQGYKPINDVNYINNCWQNGATWFFKMQQVLTHHPPQKYRIGWDF